MRVRRVRPAGRSEAHEERDHEGHAAAAALSLGIGSAYADSEGGQVANTQFTELTGVVSQAPVQNAPAVETAQNGQAVHAYVANSSRGTWLFAPNQNGGGNQG